MYKNTQTITAYSDIGARRGRTNACARTCTCAWLRHTRACQTSPGNWASPPTAASSRGTLVRTWRTLTRHVGRMAGRTNLQHDKNTCLKCLLL